METNARIAEGLNASVLRMSFNEIVLERLRDLGWTKSDLARRLDVTPSRIRALLKQEGMSEQVFKKCLLVLGLAFDIVETHRPKPPPHRARPGIMTVGTFGGDL
jgi:ribosome-binding protein aMBF1 (putative translation factor)